MPPVYGSQTRRLLYHSSDLYKDAGPQRWCCLVSYMSRRATAPPSRRTAAAAQGAGWPERASARGGRGRRRRAEPTVACGSVAGERRAHAARSAAGAATARPRRGRHVPPSRVCDLATARLTLLRAYGGPEAAAGGLRLGVARWWPVVTPELALAPWARLMRCRGCQSTHLSDIVVCVFFRDCVTYHIW